MKNISYSENITNKIMIEFSRTIQLFGLTSLEARLYAYLFLTNEARTLDEMGEALGKSKTAISTNIRSLLDLNLVTQVWKKGVRKDLYAANNQLFKAFMNFYLNKWIDATYHQKEALEETSKMIEQAKKDGAGNLTEFANLELGMHEILEFHEELEGMFKKMKQD
ncbi:transcriptional regulator [Caldibacillus lycopersici]|uniref:HTH-type transcriptional regulator n=1 Tax=Perspicuibacillus lycopersici TaxID=1325689 RepID=A0AAE3IWW2_9BACI|nr:helix-turn-helix domain-containing protein [Perspicuibacillus lycopersici]MCU9614384.1 transcriptional regulator [Perspicuibacillus lycopersici]